MAHGKPVIVRTLSVPCGISYRLRGVILSVPVDFVFYIDTGAAVSLIREDVWSRISKLRCSRISQLQEWKGKSLVGVN